MWSFRCRYGVLYYKCLDEVCNVFLSVHESANRIFALFLEGGWWWESFLNISLVCSSLIFKFHSWCKTLNLSCLWWAKNSEHEVCARSVKTPSVWSANSCRCFLPWNLSCWISLSLNYSKSTHKYTVTLYL